jgi:hypothetical protein
MKKHRFGRYTSFYEIFGKKIKYNSRHVFILYCGEFYRGSQIEGFRMKLGRCGLDFKSGDCLEKYEFYFDYPKTIEDENDIISKLKESIKEIELFGKQLLKDIRKNKQL